MSSKQEVVTGVWGGDRNLKLPEKVFFPRLFGLVVTCCHEGRGRVLVRETFANPSTERSLFLRTKTHFSFVFICRINTFKNKEKEKKTRPAGSPRKLAFRRSGRAKRRRRRRNSDV